MPHGMYPGPISAAFEFLEYTRSIEAFPGYESPGSLPRALNAQEQGVRTCAIRAIFRYISKEDDYSETPCGAAPCCQCDVDDLAARYAQRATTPKKARRRNATGRNEGRSDVQGPASPGEE